MMAVRTPLFASFLLAAGLVLALAACGDRERKEEKSEREIYEKARRYLDRERFDLAIAELQFLENLYPFGPYAEQAQLEMIYALHRSGRDEEAVEQADDFILLHPAHPKVDYAYYLKGLSQYASQENFLRKVFKLDSSVRDNAGARAALATFEQLLLEFPDTIYSREARARMVYLRNLLARSEVMIANYYLKRGAYFSALGRARHVVENFVGSPAMADALAILAYAYEKLELYDLSADALSVLKQNYPDYPLLDENAPAGVAPVVIGDRWWKRATLGLLVAPAEKFDTRSSDEVTR